MISIYNIKPQFQRVLNPILEFLHRKSITANQITLSSILLSMAIAATFFYADNCRWLFLALPLGLLVRMALNAMDGMMARRYNQTSSKGEMLNEIGDVVSDMLIFLPFIHFFPQAIWAIVIFIGLGIINEFAGVMGKVIAKVRCYDGPMGKSDRAFVVSILGILMFCGVDLAQASVWIFWSIDLLLVVSTFLRAKHALNESNKK